MVCDNDYCRGRALRIAFGTLLIFLVFAGGSGALSNDGGGSWQYYRDISINNIGGALTDYQVLVNLTGAAFPTGANASGADVRFEKGGAELAYWVEEWNSSDKKGLVWVNISSIPAGTSMMRMWYGNRNAIDNSKGESTFLFFDNFTSMASISLLS